MSACGHCGFTQMLKHQHGHEGLCCDCFDLSCGMPLGQLNEERAGKGLPPITKPWIVLRRCGACGKDYEPSALYPRAGKCDDCFFKDVAR